MKKPSIVLFLLLFLTACRSVHVQSDESLADTIPTRYAQNLTMVKFPGYTRVTLMNPWKSGQVLHEYLLADSLRFDSLRQSGAVGEATLVRVPLRRSVVFNTAHASLLGMLNVTDAIAGVADLKYMQLHDVHQRVSQGLIADCGNSMSPDVERIVELQADAVLLSPFENSGGYGRLEEIGMPIIECAEYMETSALGRAEWMLFYGLLYGCFDEANALFSQVESRYQELSQQARAAESHPSVITEKLTGSTWYVAGGRSSVGRLIADAGGTYAWASDEHSGSLPLTFEEVLDKAGEADVWLFNDLASESLTYERLESEYHGYSQLRPFREQNVWYVNSLRVPYFEEVSFRPDYLLADYVRILHPSLNLPGEMKYFTRVKE
ncbi:MAG: ABC transporter substrate-binding protein [Prevotella sp.]|nr:ABC transporter substrate-binding protein [Prevotella sp.]